MSHATESDLALYASHDLNWWRRPAMSLHLGRCQECRTRLEEYRFDRESVRILSEHLPEGVNWERLSAEMTANIRVGFAAGECVAPRERHHWSFPRGNMPLALRVSIAAMGFAALLIAAWWVNMPKGETAALGRVMKSIVQESSWRARDLRLSGLAAEEAGSHVEASSAGIELHENGGRLGILRQGVRPASVILNMQGSARARYIDSDTGQVTITGVYAE